MSETSKTWKMIQLENAFPKVPNFMEPIGTMVLVQFRLERTYTNTSLILETATRAIKKDKDYNQTVKVLKIPEEAFSVRGSNGELVKFAEKPWFKVGDYIRIPKIGLDNLYYPFGNNPEYKSYISSISNEARTALTLRHPKPLYAYVADQGYQEGTENTIPLALVDFRDVRAIVEDPLLPLNGIDQMLDNREGGLTMLPKGNE